MQLCGCRVMTVVGSTTACFITNCPPGGKRSGPTAQLGRTRTCTACGPGLQGRCLGPEICCVLGIGCFLGTREARMCHAENLVPVTCANRDLKSCGRMQEGRCAAAGLCCTEMKCEFDSSCTVEGREERVGKQRAERQHLTFLSSLPEDQWNL
ncbi:oxytocin-neurophysin 1-like [Homarus americanus]|uniref:Isotocin-neurophysin IT 1-like n=1 Tax=Homarus americanus TaxID=6706 RepID=A0A8J5MTR4_HOMAM|nr:oxytocin-neurophysin 1-like [Homarus americanus]KAG7163703.1 Isotocin-neurophysin IT 1-like [Homarus americanus]